MWTTNQNYFYSMNAHFQCLSDPEDDLTVDENASLQPPIAPNPTDSAAQVNAPINNSAPTLNASAQVTEPVSQPLTQHAHRAPPSAGFVAHNLQPLAPTPAHNLQPITQTTPNPL